MAFFGISIEHNDARLAATLAFAKLGSGPFEILVYSTAFSDGEDPGVAPLVHIVLTSSVGEIVDHKLELHQAATSGDLIASSGEATWARWLNGAGALVAYGAVTDAAGDGPFKLSGSTGTNMYAGGNAVLGLTEIY